MTDPTSAISAGGDATRRLDGTELLGTECPFDPIADGYTMVFVIHGVAAVLIEGTATIAR